MAIIRVERSVAAPPAAVWAAIADVETISEVAPNVSRAEAEGDGVGMARRCWDREGNHWDETCVAWAPGERYTFAVDTATSGSRVHRLFSDFSGTFGVDEAEGGSVVWAAFDLEPRFGPVGDLLLQVMTPRFRGVVGTMLDNWVERIERGAGGGAVGRDTAKEDP